MVIQHNLSAMNSHRFLGINNKGTSSNLEKLSSGYKVNRAADDAAGLAISEKMRGQIRGLAMAEQNTSHGINLIQTAEGGLNETHAILQRMRELAVQSSNGTYQDVDRDQLTKEFEALKSEINRIAESTHYNNIKLLDGSLDTNAIEVLSRDARNMVKNIELAANAKHGDSYSIDISAYNAGSTTEAVRATTTVAMGAPAGGATAADTITSFKIGNTTFTNSDLTLTFGAGVTAAGAADAIVKIVQGDAQYKDMQWTIGTDGAGNITFTSKVDGADGNAILTAADLSFSSFALTGTGSLANVAVTPATNGADEVFVAPSITAVINRSTGGAAAAPTSTTTAVYDRSTNTFSIKDLDGNAITLNAARVQNGTAVISYQATKGANLTFQIGANGGQDQRVNLGVADMSSRNIGLREGDVMSNGKVAGSADAEMLATASISSITSANKAIEIIHAATNQVSGQRAELGALQNRLESTMNSLGVAKENLTAAESTIRDTDMAYEMMNFTKNNILTQAAQAMLAQANQLPQGVLQLLR